MFPGRGVYELTAMVAHVVDAAEEGPAGTVPEGHLVAHVKVRPMLAHLCLWTHRQHPAAYWQACTVSA